MSAARREREPGSRAYRLFLESVPCPAWIFDDRTLGIRAANRAAIEVYGYSRDEMLAMTLDALAPEDARARLRRRLRSRRARPAAGPVRHRTRTGVAVDVEMHVVRPPSTTGRGGTGLAWVSLSSAAPAGAGDVAFQLAPVPLVCVDAAGVVLDVNLAVGALLGQATTQLVGRPFAEIMVADEGASNRRTMRTLLSAAAWRGALRVERSDGATLSLEVAAAQTPAGLRVIALQDVGERTRAEDQLRRSNERYRRLSDHGRHVREEERARLSRDLHDRLGQALSGLKMDLAWLLALCDRFEPSTARSAIAVMMDRVDTTIGVVRRIAGDLRPGVLDRLGLQAAIEWRASEFERRSGIRCRVLAAGALPLLDHLQSTEVFRVFEEMLTNVSRHARATRVRIAMKGERGKFALQVYDNGCGIPQDAVDSEHSLGLIGMRERATLLGGTLTVSRGRRRGTLAVVRIPAKARLVERAAGSVAGDAAGVPGGGAAGHD